MIPTLKSLSLVGKDEIQIQDTNGSSWPARLSTARRVLWINMDEELTATDHAVSRRHEPTLHFAGTPSPPVSRAALSFSAATVSIEGGTAGERERSPGG